MIARRQFNGNDCIIFASTLGTYFQPRPDGNQWPYLVDFSVGYCDTSISPIHLSMQVANPTVLPQAVNFNITAWSYAKLHCSLSIERVRVRNMQSKVEPAVRIL